MNHPSQDGQVTANRLGLILRHAAVLLIISLVTLLLQWRSGAHSAAFGAEPDEASHYVTGVMIRDILLAACLVIPSHLPKISMSIIR